MAEKLAIAIIHYHLRPCGVTRVIEHTVEALGNQVDMLILSGEAPNTNSELTLFTEPFHPLGYRDGLEFPDAEKIAEDLRFTARSLLGKEPDIWHIHNHSLGKNSFTPHLVWYLTNAGCRTLLQIHDFAEDGRPENYRLLKKQFGEELNQMLYPIGDHVWYATINTRDQSFLESIGIPNVHLLPNAVTARLARAAAAPSFRTVLYPVRAIRRKNMGEFLLWSLLAPEGYLFQSTLAPQNPQWESGYTDWVAFAKELDLPVEFDVGRKHDFPGLVQQAHMLITTSIAEGFGLTFLEPWLMGKMLFGRKLPEITADFEERGLDLSTLYSTLPVPLEWIDSKAFFHVLETAMQRSYETYGIKWRSRMLEEASTALVVEGKVDFGILEEPLQRKVIRHLAENPADRKKIAPFFPNIPATLVKHNRKIVREHYCLKAYGERLLNLYRTLAAVEPGKIAHAGNLLECFLKPPRFNLLRT